jgi:hypothetical protein
MNRSRTRNFKERLRLREKGRGAAGQSFLENYEETAGRPGLNVIDLGVRDPSHFHGSGEPSKTSL